MRHDRPRGQVGQTVQTLRHSGAGRRKRAPEQQDQRSSGVAGDIPAATAGVSSGARGTAFVLRPARGRRRGAVARRVARRRRPYRQNATSVPTARRSVRETLADLGLLAAWGAAEMLVSEVDTNAVLHARIELTVSVGPLGTEFGQRAGPIDGDPEAAQYVTDSTTGRGLRLLATLAVAWGVEPASTGKTVWFEVMAAGDSGTPVTPWEADTDLDALLAATGGADHEQPRAPTGLLRQPISAAPARSAA